MRSATRHPPVVLALLATAACGGGGSGSPPDAGRDAARDATRDAAHVDDGGALDASAPDDVPVDTDAGTDDDAAPDAEMADVPVVPVIHTFRNPLNPGADPYMTFYNGNYYLSTTQGDAIRMWHAPTLRGLASSAPVTVWQDTDPSRNHDVWAPSFYLIGGHWYVYYTADDGNDANHRIYCVESDGTDPLGPYHFKDVVAPPLGNTGARTFAIDPALLFQNGQQYMVWSGHIIDGNNRLYVARMSSPWDIVGGAHYIPAAGACSNVHEAPSILQHGGLTFLVYSNCETRLPTYQLRMLSIASTDDPMTATWHEYPDAVFQQDAANGVFGPGSNGFFTSPDGTEDWIVYHGKVTDGTEDYNRSTRAQRFGWNGDGTPNFGVPLSLDTDIDLPAGDPGSP